MSNLSFTSNALGNMAADDHLNPQMNHSNKWNHYQSAYREFHSTVTALLDVDNDNVLWRRLDEYVQRYRGLITSHGRCQMINGLRLLYR